MRVLVPLDGSALSESAVEQAVKLAKEMMAEVHLLSVLDAKHIHQTYAKTPEQNIAAWVFEWAGREPPGLLSDRSYGKMAENPEQALEAAKDHVHSYLTLVAEKFRPLQVKLMVSGSEISSALEITSYIHREKIDLIVMATHGRTGLARFILGSVAAKVLETAGIPVVLVRPMGLSPGGR